MTTAALAHGLFALCQQGKFAEAVDTYYASDAVSLEPAGPAREVVGIPAIHAKSQWWRENNEVHGASVEGPWLLDGSDTFVIRFSIDCTFKPTGERSLLDELAYYQVRDGKVVREQFFYNAS